MTFCYLRPTKSRCCLSLFCITDDSWASVIVSCIRGNGMAHPLCQIRSALLSRLIYKGLLHKLPPFVVSLPCQRHYTHTAPGVWKLVRTRFYSMELWSVDTCAVTFFSSEKNPQSDFYLCLFFIYSECIACF